MIGRTTPQLPSHADWLTQEQALAIVDALRRIALGGVGHRLDDLSGIANAVMVAERSFMIYGYPELEGSAVARCVAEAFMMPDT